MRLMRLMFAGAMCVGLLSVGQAQGNDQEILEWDKQLPHGFRPIASQ